MTRAADTARRIAALAAALADIARDGEIGVDGADPADHDSSAVSDNVIAVEPSDASPSPKGKTMCRIHGPYSDRKGWRIKVVDRTTGKSRSQVFPTEEEANKEAARLRREAARQLGVSLEAALIAYEEHLVAKGNLPRSVASTLERLRAAFRGYEQVSAAFTPDEAKSIWAEYAKRPTRTGRPPAFDTQLNVLHEARTFTRWCYARKWRKSEDPFAKVEVVGHRRRGKEQLDRMDDARRWLATAIRLGRKGDAGAAASATALLMGMRASEVTDRLVRDLDDEGTVLVIPHAKTRAGVRRLRIPAVLRPLLSSLAKRKGGEDRLFGLEANRFWLRFAVRRICRFAGTPVIGPHGLRGTHATLAVEAGVTGDAVAASLGHGSFAVTAGHYAKPEAVTSARTHQIENLVKDRKFRTSSARKLDAA